ncbi:hypothetical protein DFJ77DRAFT_533508 [Powellomyces hirtus]|nr:hypothetical protein DFJ77DRAFT_533508 [Powellomyces hirtus]
MKFTTVSVLATLCLASSLVVAQEAPAQPTTSAGVVSSAAPSATPTAPLSSARPTSTAVPGNGTVAGQPAGNHTSPLITGLCDTAKRSPCFGPAVTKESLCSDKAIQATVADCLAKATCAGEAQTVRGMGSLPATFCLPMADKLLNPSTATTTVPLPPSTVAPFVPPSAATAAPAAGKDSGAAAVGASIKSVIAAVVGMGVVGAFAS